MSKAFKPEDGADSDEDLALEEREDAVFRPGMRNYLTPQGIEKLRAELHALLHVERPKTVEVVSWAASNGDRSENGDYIYGKRRLREIDRRIRFLSKRLEIAEVVDPATQKGDRILFGASVTIQGENGGARVVYIVGIDEADPASGKVSWLSPLAKALLQAREGDAVVLRSPSGEEEIEVVKIEYRPIP